MGLVHSILSKVYFLYIFCSLQGSLDGTLGRNDNFLRRGHCSKFAWPMAPSRAALQDDAEEPFSTETESEDSDSQRLVVKRWKIAAVVVGLIGLVGAIVGIASMVLQKNKGVVLNLSGTIEELNASLDGRVRAVSSSWNALDNGWKPSIADSYYYTQPPNFTKVDRPSYFVEHS